MHSTGRVGQCLVFRQCSLLPGRTPAGHAPRSREVSQKGRGRRERHTPAPAAASSSSPSMVRAPCCEMMGLKKGPWTPEEDQLLVSYIQEHGHGNWRALPKQAGLLRCGKSCRLRWTNYLRPDIKRGNFTREEEDAVIALHHQLGNKWSAIAARLPGRTDNEIKNVWHTHLKKRLRPAEDDGGEAADQHQPKQRRRSHSHPHTQQQRKLEAVATATTTTTEPEEPTLSNSATESSWGERVSCSVAAGSANDEEEEIPELDDSFWSEELTSIDSSSASASSRTADTDFMNHFEGAIFSSNFTEDSDGGGGGGGIGMMGSFPWLTTIMQQEVEWPEQLPIS